ncbi:hypothetical protein DRJ22_01150 [Candidatus Woesearchaeota archaeon]|nr:MAG: hypothetical protein B6U93_02685 [Candidatus Woesearchaeota archaeon ex4484_78]RLE46752.1 MAG: hypothetical protein DRJ22_01150 [Candidatus Woesearchaeota archaeon]
MKIPAIAWIIIGLFISIVSGLIELKLFIWAGLVFIIIGIGKLIKEFALKEEKENKETKTQQKEYYCPRCKAKINPQSYYCQMCGQRLR